jgi:squalene synthase HpnC
MTSSDPRDTPVPLPHRYGERLAGQYIFVSPGVPDQAVFGVLAEDAFSATAGAEKSTRASPDGHVIICISNETCAGIEIMMRDGTQLSAWPAGETQPGHAAAAGENFPVAMRLLPSRHRRNLMAVYQFARTTDDIGDEAPPEDRLRLLDELEADLRRLYAGAPGLGHPVIGRLAPAIAECAIPIQPFLDLIMANRQDQVVTRYQTFEDLLGYCRLSANPVGRIVLQVFGCCTPRRAELSDHICTALQLAEHWQDVAEDYRAGRVYLPQLDLDREACSERDLAKDQASARVRSLIAFEVGRADAMLTAGAPLVGMLRGSARAAVAGYVAGGRAALAAIAAADYDVLRATPRPGKRRLVTELALAYARGR